MKTGHRPILHAAGAERATIADALIQDTVGVTEIILVFPNGPKNLPKIIWVLFAETKRFPARPKFGYPSVPYWPDRSLHFRFRHSGGRIATPKVTESCEEEKGKRGRKKLEARIQNLEFRS